MHLTKTALVQFSSFLLAYCARIHGAEAVDSAAWDDGSMPASPMAFGSDALGRAGHAAPRGPRLPSRRPSGPLVGLRGSVQLPRAGSSTVRHSFPFLYPLLHAGPLAQLCT